MPLFSSMFPVPLGKFNNAVDINIYKYYDILM
jgi:hypothetical protein